jgi:hypothetical protein
MLKHEIGINLLRYVDFTLFLTTSIKRNGIFDPIKMYKYSMELDVYNKRRNR